MRGIAHTTAVIAWLAASSFIAATGTAAIAAGASFHKIGDLGSGPDLNVPSAISTNGSVVVGQGLRWQNPSAGGTGSVELGGLSPGQTSSANGVSGDGKTVVGHAYLPMGDTEAYRWTAGGGMVGLGDFVTPPLSVASGASMDGSVIVGIGTGPGGAFRWTAAGGMVDLGNFGGRNASWARAVSGDGSIVVGYGGTPADETFAFRWTSSTGMVSLGDLPGGVPSADARAISRDGNVIVGRGTSASGSEAFRWTSATNMVGLGDLPGGAFSSIATGVTADGSIIVGSGWTAAGQSAFIWDSANEMRELKTVLTDDYGLNLTGWQLKSAYISDDGRVFAGSGVDPLGATAGWIATVPEPGSAAMLIAAASMVMSRRDRRSAGRRH